MLPLSVNTAYQSNKYFFGVIEISSFKIYKIGIFHRNSFTFFCFYSHQFFFMNLYFGTSY